MMLNEKPTKQERELMMNPAKVAQRIFVGSLPTDVMTKEDLRELFEPFGEVEGVALNINFGFVQFTNEKSAADAVAANGTIMFMGRRVDVKPARPLKRPFVDDRDRSPLRDFHDRGREPTRFPVLPDRRPFQSTNTSDKANDCEIIVVEKDQTEYAEYIEGRLKRLGMTVDLLFPNADVPVARVLTNIANRGCLFAIVILPQNEEHRSITLNILHGPPQEHRNMPLDDAINLISRSFDDRILKENPARLVEATVAAAVPLGGVTLADRHPESIQALLDLLAQNRMLTVLQYDKIIAYLQSRREMQLKIELGDAAPPSIPPTVVPSIPIGTDKQQELQSRILSILNAKGAAAAAPKPTLPVPSSNAMRGDSPVQRALSSLLQKHTAFYGNSRSDL